MSPGLGIWKNLCEVTMDMEACEMNVCSFLYSTIHLQILSGDPGEDSQVHACKLLEVTVLQCQGRIDPVRLCVCVYIFSIGTVQNLDSGMWTGLNNGLHNWTKISVTRGQRSHTAAKFWRNEVLVICTAVHYRICYKSYTEWNILIFSVTLLILPLPW